MEETEDNTKRQKDTLRPWSGKANIGKMTTTLKATYRFNAIPVKIPMAFFKELEQIIQTFVQRHKHTQNEKSQH